MAGDAWAMTASSGAPSYTASELRRIMAALLAPSGGAAGTNRFSAAEGARPGSGVVASLSGSTITVVAHAGVVSPDLSTTQGPYVYQLPASETHSLTAAHATLARVDLVYLQVSDDDEDGSGARQVASGYLAGTAGGGAPSLPARSFELARIAVPASGAGSAALTERQRYAVASGGVLPVRDATDRDDTSIVTPYAGLVVYNIAAGRIEAYSGSAWSPAGDRETPKVDQNVGNFSVTGTETDMLTAPAFTPANANRLIKLTLSWKGVSGTTAGDIISFRFKEGSTQFEQCEVRLEVGGGVHHNGGSYVALVRAPSAAAHVYKVTVERTTGAGTFNVNATATTPTSLVVEAAGPNS